jgi:hypothetical protein
MGKRAGWIYLIAFVIQALLPPGFMLAPGASGSGVFEVVVCSSQGTKIVTVDEFGQPVEPNDQHNSESVTCAYGPPPASVTTISAVDAFVERKAERVAHDRAQAFQIRRRALALRYARGPPAHISV